MPRVPGVRHEMDIVWADRDSWGDDIRRVRDREMKLIAIQLSPRTKRKGKTTYVYLLQGSRKIYYNQSARGIAYQTKGHTPAQQALYYDVFVRPPLTPAEKVWLQRNRYQFTRDVR